MRALLTAQFDKFRPLFEDGGKLRLFWPMFEGFETFWLTPDHKTHQGAHVRDPMDMKRLMIFVVYALVPCILMGWYNAGYQGYAAEGADASAIDCILRGGVAMLPLILTSYTFGGIAELLFCVVRKHEINEGFLVTAMLFPLTLPPTLPLWIAALGIIFGVIIGKEVFGGVGMNILNPALTARAFVFFAYPSTISGARVWDVGGADKSGVLNFTMAGTGVSDAYTGATPLLLVSGEEARGSDAATLLANEGWTWLDLFIGWTPGSMGEVSALGALIGAAFLVFVGIGSWRIMVGCVVGMVGMALVFNGFAGPESLASWNLPPHYHLVMGGFAFGAAFMATDPCSSAVTPTGRWIYGICIGILCVLVRVFNPAYPEGMMLSILFMNVFAPLIDYYIVKASTKRRVARLAAA
jgi:Na+-transporting NADH:ubiquinone oxidoreductase subunit B